MSGACCDDCEKTGGCCAADKAAKARGNPAKSHARKGAKAKTATKSRASSTSFLPARSHRGLARHGDSVIGLSLLPSLPARGNPVMPFGRWNAGQLVRFAPNPASLRLYSHAPPAGIEGVVVTIPVPGRGRVTSIPGPGGGLVYVRFVNGYVGGVAPGDLEKIKPRASRKELARHNPDGSERIVTPKRVGIGVAGAGLGVLLGWGVLRGVRGAQ